MTTNQLSEASDEARMITLRHPAQGCTKIQRAIFERLCCGDDRGIGAATATSLIKRGIVEQYEELLRGRFPVRIKRYRVPLEVHAQWCAWCAGQPIDKGDAKP